MASQALALVAASSFALFGNAIRPENVDKIDTLDEDLCEDVDGWKDIGAFGCGRYANKEWCSLGGVGPKWRADWGTLADWRKPGGYHAGTACCACGRQAGDAPIHVGLEAKFEYPAEAYYVDCDGSQLFEFNVSAFADAENESFVEYCAISCINHATCNYLAILPGVKCMGCDRAPDNEGPVRTRKKTVLKVAHEVTPRVGYGFCRHGPFSGRFELGNYSDPQSCLTAAESADECKNKDEVSFGELNWKGICFCDKVEDCSGLMTWHEKFIRYRRAPPASLDASGVWHVGSGFCEENSELVDLSGHHTPQSCLDAAQSAQECVNKDEVSIGEDGSRWEGGCWCDTIQTCTDQMTYNPRIIRYRDSAELTAQSDQRVGIASEHGEGTKKGGVRSTGPLLQVSTVVFFVLVNSVFGLV